MQLTADGVLNLMNSFGGLQAASSFWAPGDRVVYFLKVEKVENTDKLTFPIGFRIGQALDFGEGATFKRSFIPTTSELDAANNVLKPDFAYRVAPIFRELLNAAKEYDIEEAKKRPDPDMVKLKLADIEEDYKKKSPAVSGLRAQAFTEVVIAKLDINNNILQSGGDQGLNYGMLNVSKKKLGQLLKHLSDNSAYDGKGYLAVILPTDGSKKKAQAGQVDFVAITDPAKKLEAINPWLEAKINEIFSSKNPTKDSIEAKVYDFKPYPENEFRAQVAAYVQPRLAYFKDGEGKYRQSIVSARNVDILQNLGFVANAAEIKSLLGDEASDEIVEGSAAHAGETAQTFGGLSGPSADTIAGIQQGS